MSNSKVLALKYRPKNFDELVGQESISQTLKNSLEKNSFANGYLFSGLRGSGKTSSARIFAKTMLCEKAPTSTPCEECESCQMANRGSHIDIIEMDGASNRKIDDIRDLIEQTRYQPSIGKYKIFIIDEVHMLTKEAFNALLKTLEEPPEYVKFILATTDPLKLPQTILSRTQHFAFKKIDNKKIENHISSILQKEGVRFEIEAIQMIARNGGGSLRDTLTILQQAIVFSNGNITLSSTINMLGLIDIKIFEELLEIIEKRDRERLLAVLKRINSHEVEMIFDEFINFIKNKLFSNRVNENLLYRIALALNDGKKLLFSGSDSEFILYVTFLQMITDDEVVENKQVNKSSPKVSYQYRDIPTKQDSNYSNFFWKKVVPYIIEVNPPHEKITDEILESCIKQRVKFRGVSNRIISLSFCFNNNNDKCKDILRKKYQQITILTESKFNEEFSQKYRYQYVDCNKSNVVETQKIEQEKKISQPEKLPNMKEFFEVVKQKFPKVEEIN